MACNVFIISSADIRLQTKIFSEQKIYRSNWKSHTRYTLIAFFCLSLLACWFNVSFPSYLTTYDLRHNTQQAWPGSSSWASPSLCVSISSQDLQFLNLCFLCGGVEGLLVSILSLRSSCPFLWFPCTLPATVQTTPPTPVPRLIFKRNTHIQITSGWRTMVSMTNQSSRENEEAMSIVKPK